MADPTFSPLRLQRVVSEHEHGATTVTATFMSYKTVRKDGAPGRASDFTHMPLDAFGDLVAELMAAYVHRLDTVRVHP